SPFFSDPDGDALSFTASGLPEGLSIDGAAGIVAGTPPSAAAGAHTIRITASDGGASASDEYRLDVIGGDEPPVLPDPPPTLSTREDTPLEITSELLGADDDGASPLTVRLTPPPADASFSLGPGEATVVPAQDFNGTLTVEARVRDAHATSNAVTVTIVVEPVNDAPRIAAIPAQTATA